MNKNRSDLAIESWKNVEKGIKSANGKEGVPNLRPLFIIINNLREMKMDSIFYACLSHISLIVSKEHRYDAKTKILKILVEGNYTRFELYNESGDLFESDFIESQAPELLALASKYFNKL
jgi:hypothetical protein